MDHKEKDDFDVDIQACSAMDCTGLIPSLCHQGCFIGQGITEGRQDGTVQCRTN